MTRTRTVLAAAGVLAVGITATGVAATGSPILQGKRNGTVTAETQIIGNVRATIGTTGYTTRQSNLSDTGGAAIYGCRSGAVPVGSFDLFDKPCVRVDNLSDGLAFSFNAANGQTVGTITAGKAGDATKPFTTNATGVATGLNADRVDGLNGSDLLTTTGKAADADKLDGRDSTTFADAGDLLWAAVAADGAVGGSRGGTATASRTGNKFTVTFPVDVSGCSFTATPNTETAVSGLSLAVASAGTTKVTVDEAAPALPTPVAFHLQVIC